MSRIVATALPECIDPDDVSITVKAFLQADLPLELIELLEKIILKPSLFSDNENLQNLLLLNAIRADKGKVVSYINRLQNYNAADIARIATEHGLYEEALTIYKKHEQHTMAMTVLVEYIVSINHGVEYPMKSGADWRKPSSTVYELRIRLVSFCVLCLIFVTYSFGFRSLHKAQDPTNFAEVIEIANRAGKHDELMCYLQMAHKSLCEPKINTELA